MVPQIRIFPNWLLYLLLATALPASGTNAGAATVDLAGPIGAEVFLDGSAIGFLPLAQPLDLDRGTYLLRCELPGHQPFEITVLVASERDHKTIQARMVSLRKRTALGINLVFAGLGQQYSGHHVRGWIYHTLEAGGLITALASELNRSNLRKDYLLIKDQYDRQINADEIEYYRGETLAAYAEMEDAEQLRDTGLLVAAGAVTLSLLDSLLFFPSFEMGPGSPAYQGRVEFPHREPARGIWDTVHLAYRANF